MPCPSAACHSGCMFPQDCMRHRKPCVAFTEDKAGEQISVRTPHGKHEMTWDEAKALRNDLNSCLEMRGLGTPPTVDGEKP